MRDALISLVCAITDHSGRMHREHTEPMRLVGCSIEVSWQVRNSLHGLCRIVYAELMANLTEAWGECQLTVLDEGNLLQGAQAMEACLQCMQLLQQQKQVNIDSGLPCYQDPFPLCLLTVKPLASSLIASLTLVS